MIDSWTLFRTFLHHPLWLGLKVTFLQSSISSSMMKLAGLKPLIDMLRNRRTRRTSFFLWPCPNRILKRLLLTELTQSWVDKSSLMVASTSSNSNWQSVNTFNPKYESFLLYITRSEEGIKGNTFSFTDELSIKSARIKPNSVVLWVCFPSYSLPG